MVLTAGLAFVSQNQALLKDAALRLQKSGVSLHWPVMAFMSESSEVATNPQIDNHSLFGIHTQTFIWVFHEVLCMGIETHLSSDI